MNEVPSTYESIAAILSNSFGFAHTGEFKTICHGFHKLPERWSSCKNIANTKYYGLLELNSDEVEVITANNK